jgi:hypothetical protein
LIGAAEAGDKRVTSRPPAETDMMSSSWRRVFERQQGQCIVDLIFIVVVAGSGTRLFVCTGSERPIPAVGMDLLRYAALLITRSFDGF